MNGGQKEVGWTNEKMVIERDRENKRKTGKREREQKEGQKQKREWRDT